MNFGQHVKALREAKGLGLRQLAGIVGVDPTYLSRIENDKTPGHTPPGEDIIVRLAQALDANPDVLLGLAGKVSTELQAIIAQQPEEFAALIRQLKGAPKHVFEGVAREVRDGEW